MKAPALGTKRQALLFGTLVVLLLFFVVKWTRRDPVVNAPAPSASSGAIEGDAPRPATGRRPSQRAAQPQDVPLITERDLDPLVGGGGSTDRDLFDFREPTPRPAPVPTPAPPPPPAPGQPAFVGPLPPPGPTPTPVPPAPPFKLIGIFGTREDPIAALQVGEVTQTARTGDVVLARWILRRVGFESIDIGFVGYPPTETRRMAISP
jgi:hypothetical protein